MAAAPSHILLLLPLLLLASVLPSLTPAAAQLVDDDSTAFELPTGYALGGGEEEESGGHGRALYWRMHYYISYAALSANRIPCPARSGRSYYTHNCYRARGRVNPYHRGCSAIARCRR